jgi:hypothetical protein
VVVAERHRYCVSVLMSRLATVMAPPSSFLRGSTHLHTSLSLQPYVIGEFLAIIRDKARAQREVQQAEAAVPAATEPEGLIPYVLPVDALVSSPILRTCASVASTPQLPAMVRVRANASPECWLRRISQRSLRLCYCLQATVMDASELAKRDRQLKEAEQLDLKLVYHIGELSRELVATKNALDDAKQESAAAKGTFAAAQEHYEASLGIANSTHAEQVMLLIDLLLTVHLNTFCFSSFAHALAAAVGSLQT